jgi:hypothetical protein
MELFQKCLAFVGVCVSLLSAQTTLYAADASGQGDNSQLVPGYNEQYTFKVDGVTVGTQSAVLSKITNGRQTWIFTLNLVGSVNGQPCTFKQSGAFVVDSDGHAVSFDSISLTNGVSRAEKVIFGAKGVTADFDPVIPGIYHTFPTFGLPSLLVDDLVTPLSLASRAAHAKGTDGGFLIPVFSANFLRQAAIVFKPKVVPDWTSKHISIYDGTLEAPGHPDSTFEYWLSNNTGEIVRVYNRAERMEIDKEK